MEYTKIMWTLFVINLTLNFYLYKQNSIAMLNICAKVRALAVLLTVFEVGVVFI